MCFPGSIGMTNSTNNATDKDSTVIHRGSVTPGKQNTKAFILVQFDHQQPLPKV